MAAPGGTQDPHVTPSNEQYSEVEELLKEAPQEFDFFQAVRLFERLHPEREPVGRFTDPSREVVRFATHSSMSFPASRIQNIEWTSSGPPAILVNFMGLTGPAGVLPLYYTELVIDRIRAIFNHRMISLFYQAWEKYRFGIAFERHERDKLSRVLSNLIGIGTGGLQKRQLLRDEALFFYAGLLTLHPRSGAALRNILWDYFDVPVEVEPFVGAWYALDASTQCMFDKGNSYSEQVGIGAIVGDEIWDQQSGVRIRLGPLSLKQYVDFLPDGSAYEPLRALVRFFAGDQLDFEVQLVLKRGEVPACELGAHDAAGATSPEQVAPQLGWSTWAKTVEMYSDPSDTILRI
jgi:type VI secretion system protein ImpH